MSIKMLSASEVFNSSWQRVCVGFGLDVPDNSTQHTYQKIMEHYQEKGRAYHNLQHLSECLTWFNIAQDDIPYAAEVELALWFHDAIYNPQAHDNEIQSAALASDFLRSVQVDNDQIELVVRLIMATQHHQAVADEQQWMLDIDLSILGSNPARFEQYQLQIRQEYEFVDELIYQQKRARVLQGFYERPRIYQTDFFFSRLEKQAKLNLSHALSIDV